MSDSISSGAAPAAARVLCHRCRRPTRVCYCAALPSLETETRVVILQHPRERDMPIGTARMASLCLPQAQLHVGIQWGDSPVVQSLLTDPARPAILLSPAPGARDILADPPEGPVTLVVVDGTWSQAKVVVRENPILRALPRYAFTAPEPSVYRIRREPRAEYVSTIESLMHVLGVLEGDPARFRALLEPMQAMIDAHLAQHGRGQSPRFRRRVRPPRPPGERLPAAITERYEDLVCVVGEANVWPYRDGRRGLDDLIHWVACRPATGERFDVIAAPSTPLAPGTPDHSGLDEAVLRAGGSRAALHEAFAAFLRPTDIVCAWGYYAPSIYQASGGLIDRERLDLRAVAQLVTSARVGPLEEFAERTLPAPLQPIGAGRAGHRLAMLVEILAGWRALPRMVLQNRE